MDDHRAKTMQALEVFIETQKQLLARQRADIETLQKLKTDLVQRPSQIVNNLSEALNDKAFRISENVDCRLKLPKTLDWSAFQNSDIKPLEDYARRTKDECRQSREPWATQRSDLSELQKLVKRARITIVDPILIRFEHMSEPEPESEEEVDPIEQRREAERQKIRELKQRQIRGGLSLPLSRKSGSMGVFIRHDVDDEAMDVDVSIDDAEDMRPPAMDVAQPEALPQPRPYATKSIPIIEPSPSPPPPPPTATKIKASARSKAVDEDAYAPRKKGKVGAAQRKGSPESDEEEEAPKVSTKARGSGRSTKPKPETYKQAWSTSEQNLLEQLLEEIPEGQKFRWQQISQAMGGRRTPRQVASRVQKYFEKLKKFSLL